jgi:hypothetical protein
MQHSVCLTESPSSKKKFRVTFENGKYIDFGGKGYSDYTIHKDPIRMRSYVSRHGGIILKKLKQQINENVVHNDMLLVNKSSKENWNTSGIYTAGFWSRWLLWSYPTIHCAKKHIRDTYNIAFFNYQNINKKCKKTKT